MVLNGGNGAAPGPARTRGRQIHWRPLVHAGAAVPALALAVGAARGALGANPVETLTHVTGEWALRLLLLSLAITPARRWLGWRRLVPLRRPLGLWAFAYATAHLLVFALFDLGLDPAALVGEFVEHPYVTAGLTAWVLLLPLAVTSTRAWQRRLGRRWQRLHRAVYLAAFAAIVHFIWLVKADVLEPAVYALVLAALLLLRMLPQRRAAR